MYWVSNSVDDAVDSWESLGSNFVYDVDHPTGDVLLREWSGYCCHCHGANATIGLDDDLPRLPQQAYGTKIQRIYTKQMTK